jgi:hypothetical protein
MGSTVLLTSSWRSVQLTSSAVPVYSPWLGGAPREPGPRSAPRSPRGKDFVQLRNGPFDLDLVFAPDGIETFSGPWKRHVNVEGFPVCHPDDIIASKKAANRVKDRESLPRLRAFRDYWLSRRR